MCLGVHRLVSWISPAVEMTLRIGSIGGYVIAFSLAGLLLYALQLLPNIIWLAMPPASDVLKHNSSSHAAVNLVEQVFGIATVALLIIVITRAGTEGTNSSWLLLCAAVLLAGYYAAWVLYYQGMCLHGCSCSASLPCRPSTSSSWRAG
jgi:hypothetical protein